MVDVNPVNKNTTVSVNSSGSVSQIRTTTPQNYYDGLAKQWAISEDKVQGLDYSSKYYAQQAKENSQEALSALENVETVTTNAINQITTTKNETVDGIYNISSQTQQEITELKETLKTDLENTKVSAVTQLSKEAQEQLQKIESTGFYMRDDKLYFINSKGEEEEFAGGSGFNLFDTKISDHILTDKEAKGWALQGTYVTKALYPDFYNKCLEEYKSGQATKKWLKSNVILKGSLNDNQGILSGFNSTSWAILPENFSPNSNSWEMLFKITTGNIGTGQDIVNTSSLAYQHVGISISETGLVNFYGFINNTSTKLFDITGNTKLLSSTQYYIKAKYNPDTGYILEISTDGDIYNLEATSSVTTPISSGRNIALGADFGGDGAYFGSSFTGTIDLNESCIKINGEDWWKGADNYWLYINANRHQFYSIAEKPTVDKIFNQYGIADFYGIDEENERVFLPRESHGEVIEIKESGKNGTSGYRVYSDGYCEQWGLSGSAGANGSTTVTFSKAFPDTNYSLTFCPISGMELISGRFSATKTATLATFHNGYSRASQFNWLACGYLEKKEYNPSTKLKYYCVGNTEVAQAITNVTEITTSENDSIPLYTGQYFDFNPKHPSWLKAGEQQNSGGIYADCYNGLVEAVSGTNPKGLKVINIADKLADVDYSEYWILDQDNLTFRTPLAIATKSLSGAVKGNGMTLGLTDGKTNVGLYNSSVEPNNMSFRTDVYNAPVGSTISTNGTASNTSLGAATDPTKLGIIAVHSTAQLYFKVANAVQNLELLDAGEVLEALTDKLDRGHKEEITSWGIPDYSASTSINFTAGTTWVVPYDCELFFVQATDTSGGAIKLRLNNSSGTIVFYCGSSTNLAVSADRARFKKGTTLYVERSSGTWLQKIIIPLIGVNL